MGRALTIEGFATNYLDFVLLYTFVVMISYIHFGGKISHCILSFM